MFVNALEFTRFSPGHVLKALRLFSRVTQSDAASIGGARLFAVIDSTPNSISPLASAPICVISCATAGSGATSQAECQARPGRHGGQSSRSSGPLQRKGRSASPLYPLNRSSLLPRTLARPLDCLAILFRSSCAKFSSIYQTARFYGALRPGVCLGMVLVGNRVICHLAADELGRH